MKRQLNLSPLRSTFQKLWDLNIKAMPSALLWAVSFWFVIESHSILIRSAAIAVASLAAIGSAVIAVNGSKTFGKVSWGPALRDVFSWKTLVASGSILDLSIENLPIVHSGGTFEKTLFLSIFFSSLIIWLFVSLVLVPLRIQRLGKEMPLNTASRALNYAHHNKRYVLLSISVMLFGWPIFFVYMFLALTFAQCVTLSSDEDLVDASNNSTNVRVQIA